MRSKKIEFRMPWEFYDILAEEVSRTGHKTVGGYLMAVAFWQVFHARRMRWLRDLTNLRKTKLQDMILHELILVPMDLDDLIALARFLRDRRKRTSTRPHNKSASGYRRGDRT
jgi:hypothetical protein